MTDCCKRCKQVYGARNHLSAPENGGTIERTALPSVNDRWTFGGVPREVAFTFESTDATEWIEIRLGNDTHRVYANETLTFTDTACRGCGEGTWVWTEIVVRAVSAAGAGATRTVRVGAV